MCVCVCVSVCVCVGGDENVCACVCACVCLCVYMFVCVCVCLYVWGENVCVCGRMRVCEYNVITIHLSTLHVWWYVKNTSTVIHLQAIISWDVVCVCRCQLSTT